MMVNVHITPDALSAAHEACLCEVSYSEDYPARNSKEFQSCLEYFDQTDDWCDGCCKVVQITVTKRTVPGGPS